MPARKDANASTATQTNTPDIKIIKSDDVIVVANTSKWNKEYGMEQTMHVSNQPVVTTVNGIDNKASV